MKRKQLSFGPIGRERQSKAQRTTGNTPEQSEAGTSAGPRSSAEAVESDRKLFASRKVSTGRRLVFNFLSSEGFTFGEKIKELGWEFLCTLDNPSYPNLMKEFYFNLTEKSNGIESSVKGIKIVLNDYILGSIIKIEALGYERQTLGEEDKKAVTELLTGMADTEDLKANSLSPEMRLLHHLCCRLFLPRAGGYDRVTQLDLVVMWHILKGIKLNLPALILRRMMDLRNRKGGCLPYGMILTEVFKYKKIPLENEVTKNLLASDVYSTHTLQRMNFIKKNGVWTVEEESTARRTEAENQENQPAQPRQSADQQEGPSADFSESVPVVARLHPEDLRVLLEEMKKEILPEVAALNKKLNILHRDMEDRFARMSERDSQISGVCWKSFRRLEELEKDVKEINLKAVALQETAKDTNDKICLQGKKLTAIAQVLGKLKDLSYLIFRQIELHCSAGYANTQSIFNALQCMFTWLKKPEEQSAEAAEKSMGKFVYGNVQNLQTTIGISAAEFAKASSSKPSPSQPAQSSPIPPSKPPTIPSQNLNKN